MFWNKNWGFVLILLVGLYLRTYNLVPLFGYGHEQDLQAWIVRDLLVERHLRLIGQETSITGLFIGPLYYYLLVPFFAIFGMDPLASYIPITAVSILTLVSVFVVFNRLHGKRTALVGGFVYAVSPTIVFLDRWVVPTQTTLLWTVWFLYVVVSLARKKIEVIPILIVLVGLIWHIHVAFVPLLVLVPIAWWLGRVNVVSEVESMDKKWLFVSLGVFGILIAPLLAFELRHEFGQARGVLGVNTVEAGSGLELREGAEKMLAVIGYMAKVVASPLTDRREWAGVYFLLFLGFIYFLYRKKVSARKELVIICIWLVDVFVGQIVSRHIVTDYYFNNLVILSVLVLGLVGGWLYSNERMKLVVWVVGALLFVDGFNSVVHARVQVGEYVDKKAVVEYVAMDARENGYGCVGINYIGDIPVRYGYRYLFWWKGVRQISPGGEVPVYSIVRPFTVSESEISFKSGDIGVIKPQGYDGGGMEVCDDPARQLLPLNGFVGR